MKAYGGLMQKAPNYRVMGHVILQTEICEEMKMPVLAMNAQNGCLCDIYVIRSRDMETVQ